MQEEKRTSVRMKIFMVAILVLLCSILGMYIFNIVTVNKEFISTESKSSIDCISLGFEIVNAELSNGVLVVTMKNSASSDDDVNSITAKTKGYSDTKQVYIPPSRTVDLVFDNFTDTSDFVEIFPNNCDKFARKIPLTTTS